MESPQIPHRRHSRERRPLNNRHSREGGNPSPTGCATMTPEPVRHAPRPTPTSVIPANAGIHPRQGAPLWTPEPVRHAPRPTPTSVIPANAGIHPPTGCATMTPEPVRRARRPTPTSVIPAKSLPSRRRGRESIPDRVRHYDTGSSPTRPPAHPHLRHSREGGNPSPTGCATMTPEAVRHAPRPTPTSVIPANAGIHPRQGAPL